MDAPTLICPLIDFGRANQRQDGDQGKEESGHTAASMQGRSATVQAAGVSPYGLKTPCSRY